MKLKFFTILLFLQTVTCLAMNEAPLRKGLIVTIHQKHISIDPGILQSIEPMLKGLGFMVSMDGTLNASPLGDAIKRFSQKINTNPNITARAIIEAWDDARADWIRENAQDKYDNVYIITGKNMNDNHIKSEWRKAFAENNVVDYISMVHGGDQYIKPEWQVPENSQKLRMVYSEACMGGNGKDHFIGQYGAMASAGHNKNIDKSRSPLFSFFFLNEWLKGENFGGALFNAWNYGFVNLINSSITGKLLEMLGFAPLNPELSKQATLVQYAHTDNNNEININSPYAASSNNVQEEEVLDLENF